ncbi:MAG TPA: VOC family protein [Dehalococcoidia bacterium]|nr:VOC family protein [Dehalococcoidia bacterium]
MSDRVVHFEATGKDGQQIRDFYGNVFGWGFNVMPEMDYGLVDNGGKGINGGIGGAGQSPSWAPFYVAVADLQAALDKAESLGGKTMMPPMEIPGVVSLAMFSDPDGNVIGLVKDDPKMTPPPSNAPPAENPVTWFEIMGRDGQKTQDFYAQLFGWNYNVMDGYAMIDGGEGAIGGGVGAAQGDPYACWLAEVADPEATLNKAASGGGQIVMPATDVGMVVYGQFKDPAGNLVGVFKSNQQN